MIFNLALEAFARAAEKCGWSVVHASQQPQQKPPAKTKPRFPQHWLEPLETDWPPDDGELRQDEPN